jgi:acyl carrier protein
MRVRVTSLLLQSAEKPLLSEFQWLNWAHRNGAIMTRHFLLPARTLRPQCSLLGLGLNSLERREFYCTIEQPFRLTLDDRQLQQARTLHDLAAYVRRTLRPRPALVPVS